MRNTANMVIIRIKPECIPHHGVGTCIVEKQVVLFHNVPNPRNGAQTQRKRLNNFQFAAHGANGLQFRAQTSAERAVILKRIAALQHGFHFFSSLFQILAHHNQVVVDGVYVFIKPPARHGILINLHNVEHNGHENVHFTLDRYRRKFGKQFPNGMIGCKRFQNFNIFVNIDIDPARFNNKKREN